MITKEGEGHLNDGIDQERNAILIKRKYPSLDSLKVKKQERIDYLLFNKINILLLAF